MIHSNRARLEDGVFRVDRKFHTGMQEYLRHLDGPITSVHPALDAGTEGTVMDLIGVPEAELGYGVMTLECSERNKPAPTEAERLRAQIQRSRLVYGSGFGSRAMCAASGVPYVAVLEYNLRTNIAFARSEVEGFARQAWRAARATRYHLFDLIPSMRSAAMLHCNGYPSYNEAARFNSRRLLYLDSRMRTSMLISEARLDARLAGRRARLPRLIFSGRLESTKGALDVVKVAGEAALRDVPFELVIYGQGAQRAAMDEWVTRHGLADRVKIHAPVPYPELVELTMDCDVFVCCHIQDDPSCTYLESMGCGLPIVGYDNAMWKAMQESSRAGVVTPLGSTAQVAEALRALLTDGARLDELSRQARAFAAAHTFEHEFAHRTDSIKELLATRPS